MTETRYLKAIVSNQILTFEEYNAFVVKEAKNLWTISDSIEKETFDNNFEKYLVRLQNEPDTDFIEVDENGDEVEFF